MLSLVEYAGNINTPISVITFTGESMPNYVQNSADCSPLMLLCFEQREIGCARRSPGCCHALDERALNFK